MERAVVVIAIVLLAMLNSTNSTDKNTTEEIQNTTRRERLSAAVAYVFRDQNIFFSPEMIHGSMLFVYIGIEESGSSELENALNYEGMVLGDFKLNSTKIFEWRNPQGAPIANSLTRFFVKKGYEMKKEYIMFMRHMEGKPENIEFSAAKLKEVNNMYLQSLGPDIGQVVQPAIWKPDNLAVLVNAVYFNMTWQRTFNVAATYMRNFTVNAQRVVRVEMMHEDSKFQWGVLNELNATAVALPFAEANLTMLLIKPHFATGLLRLEQELSFLDKPGLLSNLTTHEVFVALPKLQINCDLDLGPVMVRLGVKKIFKLTKDFTTLLKRNKPFSVSGLRHVTTFEFNELGVGAAPTPAGFGSLTKTFDSVKYFIADHPFCFFIVDNKSIFFAGHITTF